MQILGELLLLLFPCGVAMLFVALSKGEESNNENNANGTDSNGNETRRSSTE